MAEIGPMESAAAAAAPPAVETSGLTQGLNEAWIAIAALFALSLLALPLMNLVHLRKSALGPKT